jgi:hypothetical protein
MRFAGETLIERALPVTFQVEGNIGETRSFETFGDSRSHVRSHRAGQFVEGDFNARQFVVEADAELAETEFAESSFAAFD